MTRIKQRTAKYRISNRRIAKGGILRFIFLIIKSLSLLFLIFLNFGVEYEKDTTGAMANTQGLSIG
jgi:hypothetical protein